MKKLLLLCLTMTLLSTSALVAAEKKSTKADEKPYVGFGLGITDATGLDTGYSLVLNAGKLLPKVAEKFGVEGAFTRTLIDPSIRNNDLSITTIAGYATYIFELAPLINLRAKGGLLYERLIGNTTESGLEVSYGFKVLYAIENKKSIYLDYTIIEKNIAIFSLGLQF